MIISRCTEQGCPVLTIGPRCVEHDVPVTRTFARGRPYLATVDANPSVPVSLVPATESVASLPGTIELAAAS